MDKPSCVFYNKSFLEDLYPFTIDKNSEGYLIKYSINSNEQNVPLVFNLKNFSLSPHSNARNSWYPIFIDTSFDGIDNKYLFGASVDSTNLGIEEVLSFEPKMNNWRVSGDVKITTDWILTSVISPFNPEYGLMCWSKYSSYKNNNTLNNLSIKNIPYNTIVYSKNDISYTVNENSVSISTTTPLVKKNDDTLLILNKDKIVRDSNEYIQPQSDIKYFIFSDLIKDQPNYNINNILFTVDPDTPNIISHLSTGEAYSYFDSEGVKNISRRNNIPSKTYLSPVLNDIYRQIYHHLTLRYPKNINTNTKIPQPMFNLKQGRLFKKLCYFLSTHPQIDRTTVSILQDKNIYNIVNDYINNTNPFDQELRTLSDTLVNIGAYFKDILIEDNTYNDPAYVPKKLLEKYGAKLRFRGDSNLTYKSTLPDGAHFKASSDIRSLCSKDLTDSIVFNNVKITAGPYVAETLISESESRLKINATFENQKSNLIPLWDIKKVQLMGESALFTVGADINVDFRNPTATSDIFELIQKPTDTNNELIIGLKSQLLFDIKQSALAGVNISFRWSKIFGSDCLRFSNFAITSVKNNGIISDGQSARFLNSSDESPYIYIKKPGKYIIECQINTGSSIRSDTINIYVTSEGVYTKPNTDPVRPARNIDLLPDDRNAIMVPNIKEFAFGKQGIFWPLYSDLNIIEPQYTLSPSLNMAGFDRKVRLDNEVNPLGSIYNKFLIPYDRDNIPNNLAQNLVFAFKCNNTIIELGHIILSYLYSEEHPHCETIYRETFDNKLIDLELNSTKTLVDPLSLRDLDVDRPASIETKNLTISSPSGELLKNIIFNNTNTSLIFEGYEYDQYIYQNAAATGGSPVVCYEIVPDSNAIVNSTQISMAKGCFHPNSGWIPSTVAASNNINNKTSIMIGDSSKRYCKSFRGLGFNEIYNDFLDEKIKIYSSTIVLQMASEAHDAPGDKSEAERKAWEITELDDHNINYGYRDLSRSIKTLYRNNDEYIVEVNTRPDGPVQSSEYCQSVPPGSSSQASGTIDFIDGESVGIKYLYPKPGPIKSTQTSRPDFRFDRGFGRTIGDIQVELNFLNYINPKELVVWLEIDPCSDVATKITRAPNPNGGASRNDCLFFSSINRKDSIQFIQNNVQNSGIASYAKQLFRLNDNQYSNSDTDPVIVDPKALIEPKAKYYLFLSNQDHIETSTYNNILRFTDHTEKSNNTNITQYISDKVKYSLLNNGIVETHPSVSAPGYSDSDILMYRTILNTNNSIIKHSISSLSKFKGLPLFDEYIDPETQKPPSANKSSTSFTLKIAVVGESDKGYVYDRILSTDNLININSVKQKLISNIASHSLCCWDLILSNDSSPLNFQDKDALGHINYKEPLKYYGYNFIGKIPSNIIPPVNLDGPNKSLVDTGLCLYSQERLTIPRISDVPSLNISPLIYIPSWSLAGELVNTANMLDQMNQQSLEFFQYFNDLRRIRYGEIFDREIYIPKFIGYPTGRSDKALISISKDNIVWFKLEAGILRYNNCPILKPKKYTYKHIHYRNEFKELAKFLLVRIDDPKDLINDNIKTIRAISAKLQTFSKYNLNQNDIINDINNLSDNALLALIKSRSTSINSDISNRKTRLKTATGDAADIIRKELEDLETILSQYMAIFDSIGSEGIQADDLIMIETLVTTNSTDSNAQSTTTSNYAFYSINKTSASSNLSAVSVTNLNQLCVNNKSIFLSNDWVSLTSYLSDYVFQTSSTSTPVDTHSAYIYICKGLRAYAAYNQGNAIKVFKPKSNLSQSEINQINNLTKQLETATTDQQKLDIEHSIFIIQYQEQTVNIKAKGIFNNGQSLYTVLILDYKIPSESIVVIQPEDRRIIVCDTSYMNQKNNQNNHYNQWGFINDSYILSQGINASNNNIFNNGMYGSGSAYNRPKKLYSPLIMNFIRDFIEYIEIQKNNMNNVTQSCKLYDPDTPVNSASYQQNEISNIFSYNILNWSNTINNRYSKTKIIQNDGGDPFNSISNIIKDDQYAAYFRHEELNFLLEGNIVNDTPDTTISGEITFDNHVIGEIIYGLFDRSQLRTLFDRLDTIHDEIISLQDSIKSLERGSQTENTWNQIFQYKNTINRLHIEYNKIYFYLEKLNVNFNTKTFNNPILDPEILPNVYINISINETDNSLSVSETINDDYYIINIDPEQGCSLDTDKSPKILTKITYECLGSVGLGSSVLYYVDPYRFCGSSTGGPQAQPTTDIVGGLYKVESQTRGSLIYTILPNKLEEFKNKYASVSGLAWGQTRSYERSFFLNGKDYRGGIVKATYEYLVPTYSDTDARTPEGQQKNKVKDIFNLDNVNNLFIDFKKITRNLRNVDNLYDKYIPSLNGGLTKSLTPSPGGPIDNTFKIWQCYHENTKISVELPRNIKWANLAKYLAYYNTYFIDNQMFDINNGLSMIKTRDEFGLIPYDYK